MALIALERHPESRGGAVHGIGVRLTRSGGTLSLTYVIEGKIDALRVPPPRPPRMAERLWQHTCCELFVARRGTPAYHEFNFSPSGEWAAYAFTDYRQGGPFTASDPRIAAQARAGKLEIAASVDLGSMQNLLVGLSAVIEHPDGTLSYWALRHAPGKPDFHQRDAFALELA